jgi:hypothetical protein
MTQKRMAKGQKIAIFRSAICYLSAAWSVNIYRGEQQHIFKVLTLRSGELAAKTTSRER